MAFITNLLVFIVFLFYGIIQNTSIVLKQSTYQYNKNYGLAIQAVNNTKNQNLDLTYDITKSKGKQYYQQINDEAFVYWTGGPIMNDDWKKLSKKYSWIFHQNWFSKTPDDKKVKGFYKTNLDLYWGVQEQWKGIALNKYFDEPFKTSGVNEFNFYTIYQPLKKGDVDFKNSFNYERWQNKVREMLDNQVKSMHELSKNLKNLGYKKVHYFGYSFGSFLINYYIKKYGDKAFENVDSIVSGATRIKFSQEEINIAKKSGPNKFPFKIYNKEDGRYTKTYTLDVVENAATIASILPIFKFIAQQNYYDPIKNLSLENKKKFWILTTPYDFRVGSFTKQEQEISKYGVNLIEVPSKDLINYDKFYLTKKPRKVDTKFKTGFFGGLNHHNLLLKYFMHNFKELYNTNVINNEQLTLNKKSYFCIIPTKINMNCEK